MSNNTPTIEEITARIENGLDVPSPIVEQEGYGVVNLETFCQEVTKCYPQEIRTAFEANFTEAERDVIKEYFNTEITSCANVGDTIFSWNAELEGTDGLQD